MRNQKLRESKNPELQRKALEKTVKKQVGSRSSDEMQDEKQRPGDTPETCSEQLGVRTRLPSLRSRLTSCLTSLHGAPKDPLVFTDENSEQGMVVAGGNHHSGSGVSKRSVKSLIVNIYSFAHPC